MIPHNMTFRIFILLLIRDHLSRDTHNRYRIEDSCTMDFRLCRQRMQRQRARVAVIVGMSEQTVSASKVQVTMGNLVPQHAVHIIE